jgi:hypothetical protein
MGIKYPEPWADILNNAVCKRHFRLDKNSVLMLADILPLEMQMTVASLSHLSNVWLPLNYFEGGRLIRIPAHCGIVSETAAALRSTMLETSLLQ